MHDADAQQIRLILSELNAETLRLARRPMWMPAVTAIGILVAGVLFGELLRWLG
jgi:hypothetical protein